MDNHKISFFVFIHKKTWFMYTRRPHFSEFSKFGDLNVVESPLVILSRDFIKNIFKSTYYYFKYSRKVKKDEVSGANIIRPLLLFSTSLKSKYAITNKIDYFLIQLQIKKLKRKTSQNYNVYMLTDRAQSWLIQKNSKILYTLDMNDEWSMISYNDKYRQAIETEVRDLINRVDLVTTVTIKLKDKYNTDNKVYFLPNAVDINHYVPSFDNSTQKKKQNALNYDKGFIKTGKTDPRKYLKSLDVIKDIARPAVGSISGLSGNWSDFEFMSRVEELLPGKFNMVSSGNIFPPTKSEFMPGYNNYMTKQRMRFFEHLDYSILPDFLNSIDVGIVMHRMDEFNKHSAPNKIWAYLAMGLPVVSTDFLDDPDKEVFEGMVHFARTPEQYVDCIVKAFDNDNQYLKNKRRELALKNSTYSRAKKLFNIIQDTINQKLCTD